MKDGSEKSSEAPKSENGDEMDQSAGYDSAAEEMLQAIHSKDAEGLKRALKSFVEMCSNEGPEAEEPEEA
jgi:hypothetical protein